MPTERAKELNADDRAALQGAHDKLETAQRELADTYKTLTRAYAIPAGEGIDVATGAISKPPAGH